MAESLLMDWIVYAESTGIRMLQKFAKTLRIHAFGSPEAPSHAPLSRYSVAD